MRASYRLPMVPLLLLWAVCSVVQVQAEVKAVKLCGREFIRAVVYTCGGSRWRRLLTPQNDGKSKYYIYIILIMLLHSMIKKLCFTFICMSLFTISLLSQLLFTGITDGL